LAAAVVLALVIGGICLVIRSQPAAPAKISVRYLSRLDRPGITLVRLAITNTGGSTIFTSSLALIETMGSSNKWNASINSQIERLRPGEGLVADCLLSDAAIEALRERWRLICYFGGSGLRSRIAAWQWGVNGPGPRVNWLIPPFLKGMPLNVIATSDWNDPAPESPSEVSSRQPWKSTPSHQPTPLQPQNQ
jgi:hypothetical protein